MSQSTIFFLMLVVLLYSLSYHHLSAWFGASTKILACGVHIFLLFISNLLGFWGKSTLHSERLRNALKQLLAAVRASQAALVVKNLPGHSDVRDAGSILGWGRPIPTLLPGEPHGQRSLAGYGP